MSQPIQPSDSPFYTARIATQADVKALASLTAAFHQERVAIDPSRTLKPGFDWEHYVRDRISQPLHYYWLLEHRDVAEKDAGKDAEQDPIVGFLFVLGRDEAPSDDLPAALAQTHQRLLPYQPRRLGTALALYLLPAHRNLQGIQQLIAAGIQQAQDWSISDLDLQVGTDQRGLQALLKRFGFHKTSVQYTLHFDLPADGDLPSLHPPQAERVKSAAPQSGAIPLRDPTTGERAKNPQGEPVFLSPCLDDSGNPLKTASGLPIYPPPLRHPQTQALVFSATGNVVVAPIVQDETGLAFEYQGVPQFHPPAYRAVDGKVQLQQDETGNYIFCQVERDPGGKIARAPNGKPLFQPPA